MFTKQQDSPQTKAIKKILNQIQNIRIYILPSFFC